MKFHSIFILLLILSLILSPLAAIGKPDDPAGETKKESGSTTQKADKRTEETVSVFLHDAKKVTQYALREYLIGCVAAEMNAGCHEQALMAQAVASFTYLRRKQADEKNSPTKSLQGADITDNSETHQGYIDKSAREKKWGDKSAVYEEKIAAAVDAVWGTLMTYGGQPICAAFHAISPGKTESAKEVWGKDYPYLQSVLSAGDKLSPDFAKTVVFTKAQFQKKAETIQDVKLSGDSSEWVGKITLTDAGTVKNILLGESSVSGTALREAFGLASAAFTIQYQDGGFQCKTKGYGHAVGMSQYGADYMARQGSTWQEILRHYYTGVTIAQE